MQPEVYQDRLAVLAIGLGGCYGECADGSHITYYDRRLRPYYGELIEGGYVIDKSAILDTKPGLAVLSPMCKGSLASGKSDPFQGAEDSIVAHAIAGDSNNPASFFAKLMLAAPTCGSFDFIAPDLYAAWWAKNGARIGQRQGDRIVWSDGQEETIPPYDRRYEEVAQ